jgi:hypothetical protein
MVKRLMTVPFMALLLLAALGNVAGVANAAPHASSARPAIAAWDCPTGDLCVWNQENGVGARCTWSNADPDWLSGSIRCSWAGTSPVRSFYNHGVSTSFSGVTLYLSPNYQNKYFCAPQGSTWNVPSPGVFLRSHKWTTGAC